MKFITLHSKTDSSQDGLQNPVLINCNTIRNVTVYLNSAYGNQSQIWFNNEDWIGVRETVQEIAALIG